MQAPGKSIPRTDITFATDSLVTYFLNASISRRFLFFLYTIGGYFCHRFMAACYDFLIEVIKTMATFTHKIKDQLQDIQVQSQDEESVSLDRTVNTSSPESAEIGGLFVLQDTKLTSMDRLVVLIPNLDIDEADIAREIWNLAFPPGLTVLFLGLCPNVNEEPRVRRRLATLAALTRDQRVSVEIQLEFGRNWIKKLKTVLKAGDMVVCHAEQQAGIWRQPLELALSHLNIPILTLKGFVPSMYESSSTFLRELVFWSVSIAVLFVFFLSQIRILRISEEWAKDTLLSLSILIEFGLLGIWNNLSH